MSAIWAIILQIQFWFQYPLDLETWTKCSFHCCYIGSENISPLFIASTTWVYLSKWMTVDFCRENSFEILFWPWNLTEMESLGAKMWIMYHFGGAHQSRYYSANILPRRKRQHYLLCFFFAPPPFPTHPISICEKMPSRYHCGRFLAF